MRIGDANDNNPICPTLPEIQLRRDADIGYIVLERLMVTDADINENARIRFLQVVDDVGNEHPLLTVDENGQISTQ